MRTQAGRSAPRGRRVAGDAVREAALAAGVSIDCLVRPRAVGDVSRRVLIGAGLLGAAAVGALFHFAGADIGGGLTAGQPGLLAGLVRPASEVEPATRP